MTKKKQDYYEFTPLEYFQLSEEDKMKIITPYKEKKPDNLINCINRLADIESRVLSELQEIKILLMYNKEK